MDKHNGKHSGVVSSHKKDSTLHHSNCSENGLCSEVSGHHRDFSSLTTVDEEECKDDLLVTNSSATFAPLTSKHLIATTGARSKSPKTQDLTTYKSLCQKMKTFSKVPSPYHAMSTTMPIEKCPAKTSDTGTEDTGYKSILSSVDSVDESSARHKKHQETHSSTKYRNSSTHHVRIPTQTSKMHLDPDSFSKLLIHKLQGLLKEQNSLMRSHEDLADVDAQSILDKHISRVWGDSSGELSPGEKVSSWVMEASKYYNAHSIDNKREHSNNNNCVGQDLQKEEVVRRKLNSGYRLGSIDEGLGQSMNSLTISQRAHEKSSVINSRDNCLTGDGMTLMMKSMKKASSLRVNSSTLCPSSSCGGSSKDCISVIYQIAGESLPYLSKISASEITLKQFKCLIQRKGKYRYFFKRQCDELDVGVVFEEIMDDNERVPLWEGKIFARLESLD